MTDPQIYRLKFASGFHVDDYGNQSCGQSDDFIHSDTLSSAALSVQALRAPGKIREMAKSPPYLLSSAFPFCGKTLFLPVPNVSNGRGLLEERKDAGDSFAPRKKLKKIQFIPAGLWGRLLSDPECLLTPLDPSGSLFSPSKDSNPKERYKPLDSVLIPEDLFVSASKAAKLSPQLLTHESVQRTAVSRLDSQAEESQLFPFSRAHYRREAGLWFFARFSDQKSQLEFEEALRILGDTGLGSGKNSGSGLFAFSKGDFSSSFPFLRAEGEPSLLAVKPQPAGGPRSEAPESKKAGLSKRLCLLSLFCPGREEQKNMSWLDEGAGYKLKRRGGWIHGSSLRRKSLFMFAEGSCFSRPEAQILKGEVQDVTPEVSGSSLSHRVFRDGRGFFIGF